MTVAYELGPFRLDPEAGVLTCAGTAMALGTRAVAVLTTLVQHANEYVPKTRIIEAAWPGLVVEEGNLAVQIAAIRRVLSQAGGERWIETLPRRGYRFVGPAVKLSDESQPSLGGKSNLPVLLTSFIGRERELAEIKRLLSTRRLLTIVGVGGIGKTRLAHQLAAEIVDAYRDGVWFVDLASLADPTLVPSAVAAVVSARDTPGRSLIDTLRRSLKHRQLLLILDNCEHVLRAAADLTGALLSEAAGLAIVATSREPLGVPGEQTYSLPPLSVPDSASIPDTVGHSEAVQLFLDRAQRHQPGFTLTPARAPAVAQLCIHLDGIPLALELAAARIRSLSVEQLHERLDRRFRLLTSKGSVPRQQTLRATLDWSFDLLPEEERTLFRRLAVFTGGFTLDAAAAVASDSAIDEHAVIDLLAQLVSRSLVNAGTSERVARYHLLETVRAYALEKLAEAGEAAVIKRRHAQYFRDFFDRATDDWSRMPDAEWGGIYPPEIDNVRAALDWAFGDEGDPSIGVGLSSGSGAIWLELSQGREGLQRLEASVARVSSQTPDAEHARLWFWLGFLSESTPAKAVGAFERAIELYRGLGDALGLACSLTHLGNYFVFSGRCEEALAPYAEAMPLLERIGRPRLLAAYFIGVGFRDVLRGDLRSARMRYEKAGSLCRDSGAERIATNVLAFQADLNWVTGDLDAALTGFREVAVLLRKQRRRAALGQNLTNQSGVLVERGQLAEALSAAREGLPLRSEAGQSWLAMDHLALRAGLAGKIPQAARLAGFADFTNTMKKWTRQPFEVRSRERLRALLGERLRADELERLLAEGAAMSEDDACRLALEE